MTVSSLLSIFFFLLPSSFIINCFNRSSTSTSFFSNRFPIDFRRALSVTFLRKPLLWKSRANVCHGSHAQNVVTEVMRKPLSWKSCANLCHGSHAQTFVMEVMLKMLSWTSWTNVSHGS